MNYKEVLKCLKMPNYVSNDFYSMLFARSIGGTAGYGKLTGTPPLTFTANGRNLINYRIYGANDGVGEQTENLCPNAFEQGSIELNGAAVDSDVRVRIRDISVQPNTAYKFTSNNYVRLVFGYNGTNPVGAILDLYQNATKNVTFITDSSTNKLAIVLMNSPNYNTSTVIKPEDVEKAMLTEGSTAPAQYIPYGYQINAEVGDGVTTTDTTIYIGDTPLAQGEYVDYGEQKVYKYVGGVLTPTEPPVALPALPTIDGKTIVDFDNTPKPSEMYIKYPK